MTTSASGPHDSATGSVRAMGIACAVVYAVVLIAVLATMGFSAGNEAAEFLQKLATRAAEPPDQTRAIRTIEMPSIAISNDITASIQRASETAKDLRFVAQFREGDKPYVVGRRANGELARLGIGDDADGAVIARIGGGHVTLDAHGKSHVMEIQAQPPRAPE